MYTRYIYKLHDLHLPAGNYTEAGFTLQLHANQLHWTSRVLHADHLYPAQTEMRRKEYIYHKIIGYFDMGKVSKGGSNASYVQPSFFLCCLVGCFPAQIYQSLVTRSIPYGKLSIFCVLRLFLWTSFLTQHT